jgi:NitT/TauT family transport system ATP-binding protein
MSRDSTQPNDNTAGAPSGPGDGPIVSYKHVQKVYGEGAEAVKAVEQFSADIEEGEFVSFVGPSGCGKSTLLHLTTGIIEASSGTVTVSGNDVQSDAHEMHKVGLVFQSSVLLDWRTVMKNILLPIEIMNSNGVLEKDVEFYRNRASELIELVGLEGFEDSYPQELSGGMQQRVSICRSLVYDPPILLMDEPFGALDALTRDQLNEELLDIWRDTKKTILFVTHNLEEAIFLSDRIFVLSERPSSIVDVIDVDLERPRTEDVRTTEQYQDLVARAYEYFNSGGGVENGAAETDQ